MAAIGFGDLQGLQGLQVPREQRAIKVTLALQVQQGRSAQQAQKVPRDPLDLLDLLDLGGPRGLLVLLEIQQRHPDASRRNELLHSMRQPWYKPRIRVMGRVPKAMRT